MDERVSKSTERFQIDANLVTCTSSRTYVHTCSLHAFITQHPYTRPCQAKIEYMHVRIYVCMYVRMYVRMYARTRNLLSATELGLLQRCR